MPLVEGRSDVLTVPDSAATLVLMSNGAEVRRIPLDLVADQINEIRP